MLAVLDMDCASCNPYWTALGASVGREEALVDAMALRRLAICGSRIWGIVKFTAARGGCRRCLHAILHSRVMTVRLEFMPWGEPASVKRTGCKFLKGR